MSRPWQLLPPAPIEVRQELASYPALFSDILYRRGIRSLAEAEDFLHPSYEKSLHDPFQLRDMQTAVDLLWEAVRAQKKICIYADYDADAVTAAATLIRTLRYLGNDPTWYVPDRFTEGYGVNIPAVEQLVAGGCEVIVTVDCGTNSHDVADRCKELGVLFIVTDHHELTGPEPAAAALINPKNPVELYPHRELTGVGVAFKLAQALLKDGDRVRTRVPSHTHGYEKWLLDLVSVGTVADMHTLLGENRTLVSFGLQVMKKTRWAGLRALLELSGTDLTEHPPDVHTLGFVVAPRLNAAGRLEHAGQSLELLLEDDPERARERAQKLEEINSRRQNLTATLVSEAREKAAEISHRRIIVLMGEGWPRGIVGLVAGKLTDELKKPVLIISSDGELATGSARSVGTFNIVTALQAAGEHLTRFGGHQQAAGFSLKVDQFELFYTKLLEHAETKVDELEASPSLELEGSLVPAELTLTFARLLKRLEPCGAGNPKPKFLLPAAELLAVRWVGRESTHFQGEFKFGDVILKGIWFSAPDYVRQFPVGALLDLAGEVDINAFRGSESVQLRLSAARAASEVVS